MELHCSQTLELQQYYAESLRPLWNYTALKQSVFSAVLSVCLRPLWNYTALKLVPASIAGFRGLRPLWNYTALKLVPELHSDGKFETPMELHCSQTSCFRWWLFVGLRPLWNYTALKPFVTVPVQLIGLRPLWNYTALKPLFDLLVDCSV